MGEEEEEEGELPPRLRHRSQEPSLLSVDHDEPEDEDETGLLSRRDLSSPLSRLTESRPNPQDCPTLSTSFGGWGRIHDTPASGSSQ